MNTNKKVMLIVVVMLGALSFSTIFNVWINFRDFGKMTATDKAHSIAESVRDGLTAHMVLGTMEKRDLFLENMKKHQNVDTLRVIRSQKLIEEFGVGTTDIYKYDDIEKNVLQTGKSETVIKETPTEVILRVTIPYIATKYGNPNCLTCHIANQEGDVLGAITMEMNINDLRQLGIEAIAKTVAILILFLIIAVLVARHYIKPYVKLFDDLEDGISRAYRGDFSYHVETSLSNEAGKVARRLNDLSEIFRFKKTIELDDSKGQIYERISYILSNTFEIKSFALFENHTETNKRVVVESSEDLKHSPIFDETNLTKCRANRTGLVVNSLEFHKICKTCYMEKREYLCLPFSISPEYSLTLLLYANNKEELLKYKEMVPIISNYFELAEPVLEAKFLMHKLEERSLKDGLTGLYNRRFLDQFVEVNLPEDKDFSVMMIDIDFFKQVNDTYGHDVGDTVIKELSAVLQNNIKGSDLAIRYGGEEFLVIVFNSNYEIIEKIATSIKVEFSKKSFKANDKVFNKTLSIGIALYPEDAQRVWQAIKFADVALYQAKETGRNKIVRFENKMYTEEEI
ncbi:MAG: GGDEF domain-containing protein [Arcobacteraceae bacterium]|nr:GGDEF domain-containing protein [Arcobacteraceae bacterium]